MDDLKRIQLMLLRELGVQFENRGITYCAINELAWDAFTRNAFTINTCDCWIAVNKNDFEKLNECVVSDQRMLTVSDEACDGFAWYIAVNTTLLHVGNSKGKPLGVSIGIASVSLNEDKYVITSPETGQTILDHNPLDSCEYTLFEDTVLPIPAMPEKYFKTLMGDSWRKKYSLPYRRAAGFGVVFNPVIPYDEYLAHASESDAYSSDISEIEERFHVWKTGHFDEMKHSIERQNDLYLLLTHRFKLCEQYQDHKNTLLEAWNHGRKAEVTRAISDYTEKIKMFYEKGLVLHFDNDLFKLAIVILDLEGWEHAGELESMVNSRHVEEELSSMLTEYFIKQPIASLGTNKEGI